MEPVLQEMAVNDLLEYCRRPQHELKEGRQLAPILLGRPWTNIGDDYHLVHALQRLLEAELAARRKNVKQPEQTSGSPMTVEQLAADFALKHPPLEQLSLVWAYYFNQLESKQIAKIHKTSVRNVQYQIKHGRAEVLRLLMQQALASTEAAHIVGQHVGKAENHQPDDTTKVGAIPPGDGHPSVAQPDPHPSRWTNQHISGANVQAVIGPVHGSVNQSQTQHHNHYYNGQPESTTRTTNDNAIVWAGLLLLMVVGFWMLQTAPRLSISVLLALTLWRGVQNGWRMWQRMARDASTEDVLWYGGHTLAWLGAATWSIVLVVRSQAVVTTELFTFEQLMLIVAFVSLSMCIFWLSSVDLVIAAQLSPTNRWPWQAIRHRTAFAWQQRWMLLGLTWLMLIALSGVIFFTSLGG